MEEPPIGAPPPIQRSLPSLGPAAKNHLEQERQSAKKGDLEKKGVEKAETRTN